MGYPGLVPPFLQFGRIPAQLAAPLLADSPAYAQVFAAFAATLLEPSPVRTGQASRERPPATGRCGKRSFVARSMGSAILSPGDCPDCVIFQGARSVNLFQTVIEPSLFCGH
jgi:hypothetical protein